MGGQLSIETFLAPEKLHRSYPGGKGGSGVYQTIINHMPPHRVYIEPFAGGGRILLTKRPAKGGSIALDKDYEALTALKSLLGSRRDVKLLHRCALHFLDDYNWRGDELVYCDPPYPMEVRSHKSIYRYEMTDDQHRRLLATLRRIPAKVMLSGYWCELYADRLLGWHSVSYTTMTRGGPREEWLWMNFEPPTVLHDYRFLGSDYRERENIKRKVTRWTRNLLAMGDLERQAVLSALQAAADTGNYDEASGDV